MRLALLALAMLFAGSAAQPAQVLVCAIREHGNSGWIPEVLFLGYTEGDETAVVSDLVILSVVRAPISARIVTDNARRTTFVWNLQVAVSPTIYVPTFIWRATYQKATGVMTVSATPAGFTDRFFGTGTCRQETR